VRKTTNKIYGKLVIKKLINAGVNQTRKAHYIDSFYAKLKQPQFSKAMMKFMLMAA
jgi:hypothetical protein